MSDPIRDDTTPAYESVPLRQVGQITGRWEPFPLASFDMPPCRESRPQFVPRAICQRVLDSFGTTDADFAAAIGAMQEFFDGGANQNTGARAPIQGDA